MAQFENFPRKSLGAENQRTARQRSSLSRNRSGIQGNASSMLKEAGIDPNSQSYQDNVVSKRPTNNSYSAANTNVKTGQLKTPEVPGGEFKAPSFDHSMYYDKPDHNPAKPTPTSGFAPTYTPEKPRYSGAELGYQKPDFSQPSRISDIMRARDDVVKESSRPLPTSPPQTQQSIPHPGGGGAPSFSYVNPLGPPRTPQNSGYSAPAQPMSIMPTRRRNYGNIA